jgi:hypothetical protein
MIRAGTWRRVDILILLVAASAVALRNDREVSEQFNQSWVDAVASRWPPAVRSIVGPGLRLDSGLLAFLTVVTVGLGLAALRKPFVPAGRRWPGRGRAAIAAASLAVGIGLINVAIDAIADPTSTWSGLANPRFFSYALRRCEGAPKDWVLGAWSLLALAGRWRSEADGFEQLGRWLGWCWLASLALDLLRWTVW